MPGYNPIKTEYIVSGCNVLIRLNRRDTEELLRRLSEIKDSDGGVNLIMLNMRSAISLTESDEQGKQIKFIAYSKDQSFNSNSVQRGYRGKWSHIELAVSEDEAIIGMRTFSESFNEG